MENLAIYKFALPPVRDGKEVYDVVILCVNCHSRCLVAGPARDKGLTAEGVASHMISHCLTLLGTPKAIYSETRRSLYRRVVPYDVPVDALTPHQDPGLAHLVQWLRQTGRTPGLRAAEEVRSRASGPQLADQYVACHPGVPGPAIPVRLLPLPDFILEAQHPAGSAAGNPGESA